MKIKLLTEGKGYGLGVRVILKIKIKKLLRKIMK